MVGRERRPPFSPADVVLEFSEVLKGYGVSKIVSDRWGGDWPRERFREHGISCETGAKAKSDLYRELLPAVNSRKIDLLDHPRAISQLCSLERRTSRGGRDLISEPPHARDDIANCIAGVFSIAKRGTYTVPSAGLAGARLTLTPLPRFKLQDTGNICSNHSRYFHQLRRW
jgi:hypothetical protein